MRLIINVSKTVPESKQESTDLQPEPGMECLSDIRNSRKILCFTVLFFAANITFGYLTGDKIASCLNRELKQRRWEKIPKKTKRQLSILTNTNTPRQPGGDLSEPKLVKHTERILFHNLRSVGIKLYGGAVVIALPFIFLAFSTLGYMLGMLIKRFGCLTD